ncbi:murein hydrolase activator EnvC family protein [Streptomyces purpurogeneiscleroticus]|uniref:murein hydrolase activator EnvC family protein n=1 Tax=Streptomyces purpurogeneiscleroticus TaxID=68259 RepID=UPI001CBDFD8A|nr:M23 family metallopeptidase [Streptomyces purpurogeneiscleroticus]MBZ4019200.1 peptidase M23 [Streptomyces purpurogeneiscleroticus]
MTAFKDLAPRPFKGLTLRRTVPTAVAASALALTLTAPHDAAAVDAAGSYARPITAPYHVTARYGVPGDWAAGHHPGVDFAVPTGTRVRSVGYGTVVLARRSGDYGKAVTVRMRDGHYVVYGHLSRIAVRKGRHVGPGTRLGSSGSTGRSSGPHLHFEVRDARGYGNDINPMRYLSRRGVHMR